MNIRNKTVGVGLAVLVVLLAGCCPKEHVRWDGPYGMRDGMTFFKPEAGEATINAMIYQRGSCEVMFDYQGGSGVNSVEAAITDSKGRLAATVPLSLSGGVWKGTWKDWTSSLWTQSSQIPVGQYTANFKVNGTSVKQLSFYVIFNRFEVSADLCFCFFETVVWFGSGYNYSRALTYTLHPDDDRIFQVAIGEINGETDSYSAAHKLSDWVAGHFTYSLSYHTNDAVDLLLNHTSAQCADEACFLVALLHAVGIPSHPVTADAGVEVGDANWNFDTWIEARLKGPGKPENWYILHPHLYTGPPTIQPTLRNYFGTNYGVAKKGENDLVIMAKGDWFFHESDVIDGAADVSFGRNSCNEPNQAFTYIASWLDHLCQSGYWNAGHWGCSPAETTFIQITPSPGRLTVGEEMRYQVGEELRFQTEVFAERRMEDTCIVRVILDDLRSHQWPDTVLAEFRYSFSLDPEETKEFDAGFRIPGDLMTSDEMIIEARVGEERGYYSLEPIEVVPRFEWELEITKTTKAEPRRLLILTFENSREEAIHDIRVRLTPPFGVEIEPSMREFDVAQPGEVLEIEWVLPEAIPPVMAVATLTIESKDGGSVRITKNLAEEVRSSRKRRLLIEGKKK